MMRRKGLFTLLAAVFMAVAFSATAFAANVVVMKTTVPNIPKTTCWQAGTDTMEFDDLSKLEEGDVIEITLNNKVTLCKGLNFFMTLAANGGALDVTGSQPVSDPGAGTITVAGAGQQWGFLVQGNAGEQIVRLTLRQVTTATGALVAVTPGNMVQYSATVPTDRMIVKLFDGKGVGGFAAGSGIQKYNATTGFYSTAIVAGDNVLCIDTATQDYQGEYVQNTPNSLPVATAQKLSFSGDYTVAHIMTPIAYGQTACSKVATGHIIIGTTSQAVDTCQAFNFETAGGGYCADHTGNKLIINATGDFETVNYGVRMEILVNGLSGERGVYWSNTLPLASPYASSGTACTTGGTGALGAPSYFRGDGTTAAVPVAPILANCSGVAAPAKAVILRTAAASLGVVAGQRYIAFDFPQFNYNLNEIMAGDVVSVKVTLFKETCGDVTTQTIVVGTFGCGAVPTGARCDFPYFTSLQGGQYWNGIAISNKGTAAGNVTLTAYQMDGSTATATIAVPARGQVVNLLENMTWTGTVGSTSCWIRASSNDIAGVNLDGFAMMADGTDSMGYICKTPTP